MAYAAGLHPNREGPSQGSPQQYLASETPKVAANTAGGAGMLWLIKVNRVSARPCSPGNSAVSRSSGISSRPSSPSWGYEYGAGAPVWLPVGRLAICHSSRGGGGIASMTAADLLQCGGAMDPYVAGGRGSFRPCVTSLNIWSTSISKTVFMISSDKIRCSTMRSTSRLGACCIPMAAAIG